MLCMFSMIGMDGPVHGDGTAEAVRGGGTVAAAGIITGPITDLAVATDLEVAVADLEVAVVADLEVAVVADL